MYLDLRQEKHILDKSFGLDDSAVTASIYNEAHPSALRAGAFTMGLPIVHMPRPSSDRLP